MAIVTGGAGDILQVGLAEPVCQTVDIVHIGREDIRRNTIFIHNRLVRVTIPTDLDSLLAKVGSGRSADQVRAVTVGAGGHIRVQVLFQGGTMYTTLIGGILRQVAFLAYGGNASSIGFLNVMGAVAIRAERGVTVTFIENTSVGAIGGGLKNIRVTFLADGVDLDGNGTHIRIRQVDDQLVTNWFNTCGLPVATGT